METPLKYINELRHWSSERLFLYALASIGVSALILILITFMKRLLNGNLFSSDAFNQIKLPQRNLDLSFSNMNEHLLLISSSGSGKTSSFITPLLERIVTDSTTGVVYDYKAFDCASTLYSLSLVQAQSDVSDFYINFHEPSKSHRINVLSNMDTIADAVELSNTIIKNFSGGHQKNDFWERSGASVLSSTMWWLRKHRPDFCTLPHTIEMILQKDGIELIELLEKDSEASKLLSPISSAKSAPEQLAGSISTIKSFLKDYSTKEVYWVTSKNSPSFKSLALNSNDHPSRLVVSNNPSNPTWASPIVSLYFSASLRAMMANDRRNSMLLMDEIGTMTLGNLEGYIPVVRSYRIAMVMACQTFSQISSRYGAENAKTIRSNCKTQIVGRTGEDLDFFVKKFGTYQVKQKSTSINHNGGNTSNGASFSFVEKNRVNGTDIALLNPGEFLVSSNKMFKESVKLKSINRYSLPELTYVTPSMLNENYRRIESEIGMIK